MNSFTNNCSAKINVDQPLFSVHGELDYELKSKQVEHSTDPKDKNKNIQFSIKFNANLQGIASSKCFTEQMKLIKDLIIQIEKLQDQNTLPKQCE